MIDPDRMAKFMDSIAELTRGESRVIDAQFHTEYLAMQERFRDAGINYLKEHSPGASSEELLGVYFAQVLAEIALVKALVILKP